MCTFILQYGISGPYWYAGGATIQIIIFSILSIMLKTRAPGAKTFLQVRHFHILQRIPRHPCTLPTLRRKGPSGQNNFPFSSLFPKGSMVIGH